MPGLVPYNFKLLGFKLIDLETNRIESDLNRYINFQSCPSIHYIFKFQQNLISFRICLENQDVILCSNLCTQGLTLQFTLLNFNSSERSNKGVLQPTLSPLSKYPTEFPSGKNSKRDEGSKFFQPGWLELNSFIQIRSCL